MNSPDGGPIAASIVQQVQIDANTITEQRLQAVGGLSIRDWFAGQFVAGLLSNEKTLDVWTPMEVALDAYKMADAMLAARKEDA